MNAFQFIPFALTGVFGMCCTIYMLKVALETEYRIADEYTLLVRRSIQNIQKTPKFLPPFTILPFVTKDANYRVTPQKRLVNCMVEENMDKLLQGTFCYLFNPGRFKSNVAGIHKNEWKHNRFCSNLNDYDSTSALISHIDANHDTIFLTRDPLERFAHWYLETCHNTTICNGCDTVLCVVESVHMQVLNASRIYSTTNETLAINDFKNLYLSPQTWNCDLWKRGEDFTFVKHGETEDSHNEAVNIILHSLRKRGVEKEQLKFVEENLTRELNFDHAKEAKVEQIKKIILSSHVHRDFFVNSYYFDYHIFDYKIPSKI